MDKKPLFLEHDGAIDDLLAQLLILTQDGVFEGSFQRQTNSGI
jgi:hypothetical protein